MALQKRTIKIILITVVTLLIIGALLGILLGVLLKGGNKVELEVWPRAANGAKEPLISFKISDSNTYMPWVRRINDTLNEYNKTRKAAATANKLVECSYTNPAPQDKVCNVDVEKGFYPCTAANNYNYAAGKPCVFLKLNKLPDWTPNPYNTFESLPANMPDDLKRFIKPLSGQPKMNEIWLSCEGATTKDTENMGTAQYLVEHGYPSYYFPYKQEPYLSPIIAVTFENPTHDVIINVVCKAWAKNIAKEGSEQSAVARFQLKVES